MDRQMLGQIGSGNSRLVRLSPRHGGLPLRSGHEPTGRRLTIPAVTERGYFRSLTVQIMFLALGIVVAVTVIGLVTLWPTGDSAVDRSVLGTQKTEPARVVGLTKVECHGPNQPSCDTVTFRIRSGRDKGREGSFAAGQQTLGVGFSLGDVIRVYKLPIPAGVSIGGQKAASYAFADFERHRSLYLLAAIFGLLAVLVGRWRGLRAIVGLAISFVVVLKFVIPAVLDGGSPVGVALVGALTVMLVTIPLVHGLGAKSLAAVLGTALSLLVTGLLASLFTHVAHLSGVSSDETTFLHAAAHNVSLTGLLLAGMVIGALGVLNDSTVSQASTVMALRRANPELGFARLVREALDVGQDHIAATINTLVLAYVGASLPVLLIFSIGSTSFGNAINSEGVAEEIVATLVGSIGLILAVPITTVLAALLALRMPEKALREQHAHQH